MRTNIEISPATIPSLLGYKDSVSKLNSYQLRGVDQMVDEIYYQLPTSTHLLEMQNVLKKSIGLEENTDLVTNVKVYEGQMGLPSPINVYDVYTNLLLLEASPWAESLDPEIGSPSATTTVTTEEQVTDFSTEPVLGDEDGSQ